jgi:hypothetical protein
MAKAGTTFLFDKLALRSDLFNLPRVKEINFFARREDQLCKDDYLRNFPGHHGDRIYLDASPVYLQSQKQIAQRVSRTLERDDVRFVILLRDPTSSLFSHYLHDLKSNVCRLRNLGGHESFSLFDEEVLARYIKDRSTAVREIVEAFPGRVLGLDMSEAFKPGAARRIGDFLGVEIEEFDSAAVSNPGGWVPRYLYGGERGRHVAQGGWLYRIPPRALVLVSNDRSEIATDVDAETATLCFSLQASFTREVALPRAFFLPVHEDYLRCCDALGVAPRPYPEGEVKTFAGTEPQISASILARLERVEKLKDFTRSVFDAAGGTVVR